MKLRTILLPALAVIAVVLFCTVLASLPAVTLYEAKEDSFSAEHIDPSIRSLMTTEESATIFPLMEDLMFSCKDVVIELSAGDIEYFKRELSSYANLLSRFKTNLNKIKLSSTDLETFRLSADDVDKALAILGDDYERVLKLIEKRKTATAAERAIIDNELKLIAAETVSTVTIFSNGVESMRQIAEEYGLDTSALKESLELLDPANINVEEILSLLQIRTPEIQLSSLIYTMDPVSGVYGDTITLTGKTLPKKEINIYWGSTLWKNITSDANGGFTAKLKIEKIPAGEHVVTLSSEKELSKPTRLTVFPLNTDIKILSVEQKEKDGEKVVTIKGILTTETEVPVIDAQISVISDDYGYVFASGKSADKGIWEAAAEISEGTYRVYAEFNDKRFPLFENRSDVIEFTIDPVFGVRTIEEDKGIGGYYFVLIILIAAAGFIIWRIIRRRKQSAENSSQKPEKTSAKTPRAEKTAEKEIDPLIDITEEEIAAAEKIYPAEDTKTPSSYPAGLSAAETMREIYRCVIYALANKYTIEHIDAKTPREICALFAPASKELTTFMNTYEYFRYSGVAVTDTDLAALKETAAAIPELAKENKPQEDTSS